MANEFSGISVLASDFNMNPGAGDGDGRPEAPRPPAIPTRTPTPRRPAWAQPRSEDAVDAGNPFVDDDRQPGDDRSPANGYVDPAQYRPFPDGGGDDASEGAFGSFDRSASQQLGGDPFADAAQRMGGNRAASGFDGLLPPEGEEGHGEDPGYGETGHNEQIPPDVQAPGDYPVVDPSIVANHGTHAFGAAEPGDDMSGTEADQGGVVDDTIAPSEPLARPSRVKSGRPISVKRVASSTIALIVVGGVGFAGYWFYQHKIERHIDYAAMVKRPNLPIRVQAKDAQSAIAQKMPQLNENRPLVAKPSDASKAAQGAASVPPPPAAEERQPAKQGPSQPVPPPLSATMQPTAPVATNSGSKTPPPTSLAAMKPSSSPVAPGATAALPAAPPIAAPLTGRESSTETPAAVAALAKTTAADKKEIQSLKQALAQQSQETETIKTQMAAQVTTLETSLEAVQAKVSALSHAAAPGINGDSAVGGMSSSGAVAGMPPAALPIPTADAGTPVEIGFNLRGVSQTAAVVKTPTGLFTVPLGGEVPDGGGVAMNFKPWHGTWELLTSSGLIRPSVR